MRKDKKNKSGDNNDNFSKNKAFENKEIAGINPDATHDDDFAPEDAVETHTFGEDTSFVFKPQQECLEETAGSDANESSALFEDPGVQSETADDQTAAKQEKPITADENDGRTAHNDDVLPADALFSSESNLAPQDESDEPIQAVASSITSPSTKERTGLHILLEPILTDLYCFFYRLGLQNFRYGKRVFSRLGRLFMRPVRYTLTLSRLFVLGVDRLFFRSVHTLKEEFLYFRKEIMSSLNYLRRAAKESPLSGFAIISHYRKKAFKKYKNMFRTAFNLSLPVAALLILWATVAYWNTSTYSLQLTYNGVTIGNIQDESIYIQAQGLVNKQLGTVVDAQAITSESLEKIEEEKFVEPSSEKLTYEIERVDLNELSDEAALSDSLIENSAEKLTAACGIFIDGEFIGAVKNESDATGVFDNLLAPYKTDNTLMNAAFVEDVRFTQGLYSDNVKMLDAKQLQEKLSTKKAEAVYHTVQDGETIWSIAMANGLTESALLQQNPEQGQLIKTGEQLKISSEVNFIRVKLISTEMRTVEVPFETIKTDNPNLFKGDTRVVRKGVPGQETVTELVTYIDNVRVYAQEIDRIRVSEPVAQKSDVGTKSTKVTSASGSYNVKVSNEGFVWPVPGYSNVSSPFGYRNRGFHSGVDISGSGISGKVIVAAKDGVVVSAGWDSGGLGYRVVINHGGGITTRYGHCLSGSISVSAGQRVSAGQAIARVGSTGNSTGPHLHFEVQVNGSVVNPLPYVR